jgi:hypothetical protein
MTSRPTEGRLAIVTDDISTLHKPRHLNFVATTASGLATMLTSPDLAVLRPDAAGADPAPSAHVASHSLG